MGLVINPTAFRMGLSKSWTDAWYMHRINYPVFVHNTLTLKSLIFFILFRYFPGKFSKWIYSHITFYSRFNKMFINVYVYDANTLHFHKRLARFNKYGWWRKVRFDRFFTKKYLLDQQYMFQRWALLMQTLNLRMDTVKLDNLEYRLKRYQLRKITYLKKKYGKGWVSKESLYIWKFPIFSTYRKTYNKLGFIILNKIFKKYISRSIGKYTKSKKYIDLGRNLMGSYRKYYFFFSFVHKIIKLSPIYPRKIFSKVALRYIYRLFTMWFVYKPLFAQIAKLLKWVLMYINFDSKINIFLLNNQSITANFIARYLLMALRLKFNYYDMIIPIKKSLGRQMYARRWVSYKRFVRKEWDNYTDFYEKLKLDRKSYYKGLIAISKSLILNKFIKRRFKRKHLWFIRKRKIIFFNNLKNNLNHFLNIFKLNSKLKYLKKYNAVKKSKFVKKSIWKKYKWMVKRLKLLCVINKIYLNYYFSLLKMFLINYDIFFNIYYQNNILKKKYKLLFFKNQIYIFPKTRIKWNKNKKLKKYRKIIYFWKNFFFKFFHHIYSDVYRPFIFDSNKFKINNKEVIYFNKDLRKKKELNKNLIMIPLKNKLKKIEVLDNYKSVLYGYKFHFSGRFTRKQKAASLWFLKGSNPVSSNVTNVDYGFYTITLRYSACSLKIWLYKNKRAPTKNFKLI